MAHTHFMWKWSLHCEAAIKKTASIPKSIVSVLTTASITKRAVMVSPLVSCEWLKEQLEKKVPDLRILDGELSGQYACIDYVIH